MRAKLILLLLATLTTLRCAAAQQEEPSLATLKRVILRDDRYDTMWVGSVEVVTRAFTEKDYAIVDGDLLKEWMQEQIKLGAGDSVCVLPNGLALDTITEEKSPNCTLRKYLDAGGRVVWIGDVPFYYQAKPRRGALEVWGPEGQAAILGVQCGQPHENVAAKITDEGKKWEMTQPDVCVRPTTGEGVVALSTAPNGEACTYIKNFNPDHPQSGFLRFWGGAFNPKDTPKALENLVRVASHGLKETVPPGGDLGGTIRVLRSESSILFREIEGVLGQSCSVVIENMARSGPAVAVTRSGDKELTTTIPKLYLGRGTYEILVPTPETRAEVDIEIRIGDRKATSSCEVLPGRRWVVYLDPSVHTDIGYTDLQERVLILHNENLDKALDLCAQIPAFGWTLENAWQIENYRDNRPERVKELIQRIKEKRMGCAALYLNVMTGLCSTEVMNRLCYGAMNLKREYGIPVKHALMTDVPTVLGTLPTILANSGVRYFAEGSNQTRGPYWHKNNKTPQPYWWVGPDGSRVLTWISRNHYHQARQLGFMDSLEEATRRLIAYLKQYEARGYPYDAIFLYGALVDNEKLTGRFAETVAEWNKKWAYPKIIVSTQGEFFEYMEEKYGDQIPILEGDNGVYWEDGAGSTMGATTLAMRNQEDLTTAEKLCSLLTLSDGSVAYPEKELRDSLNKIMLYNEHTWGAHNSISAPEDPGVKAQWEYKSRYATDPALTLNGVLQDGLDALASKVKTDGPSIVVFNPHSWPVTDRVTMKKPEGLDGNALKGPQGEVVAIQESGKGEISFVARAVPGVGYRTYRAVEVASVEQRAVSFGDNSIENDFFRVVLDPESGAIASIRDKKSGRELVDQESEYKANEYLYVAGGEATKILNWHERHPAAKLEINRPKKISIERGADGPIFGSLVAEARTKMTPRLRSEIILYKDLPRIDIVNSVDKDLTYSKEGVYFAFPFNAGKPKIRIGVASGTVVPEEGQLPGACRDWFCARPWVDYDIPEVFDHIVFATPDAPLITIEDIFRGQWYRRLDIEKGALFVFAMNNYWFTNYRAGQDGNFIFRFSLAPWRRGRSPVSDLDALTASPERVGVAFGDQVSNPLRAVYAAGGGGSLPASQSFVEVSDPTVFVTALKKAEDGEGWVVRLWNVDLFEREVEIRLPALQVRSAAQANLVEEKQKDLEVRDGRIRVSVPKRSFATVRFTTE